MLPRTNARRVAAAIAIGALAVTAFQILGASASSKTSEASRAAFPAYAAPSGPELDLSQVQSAALKYASDAHEASPTEITVAHGSFAAARDALDAGSGPRPPSQPSAAMAEWEHSSAYLVVMRGEFTLNAPTPHGRRLPSGPVMALILDAHTGFPEGRYVGEAAPDPAAVGTVQVLR